jgi:apolipoprotein N-acyltransferase
MATASDARPAPPARSHAPQEPRPRRPGLILPALGALPIPAPFAYAAAVLSGLLYWLAFAGMDVWPLAFVAWVPLVVAMHRQSVRRATLLGWLAGVTMNVAGFFWLQQMLQNFSGFPAPICFFFVLVVCAYQGGRIGLLGWLYGRASARGWPAMPVFAAAFVASELLYPLLFPWYYAATVHQVPLLVQLADVGGPILVGLVLVAANLAVAELALARLERRKPVVGTLASGAVVTAFACAYGQLRIGAVDAMAQAAPAAKVGVVQANMGLMEKRSSFDEGLRRHLDESHELEDGAHVDFVVWSETSAMRAVSDDSYRQQLRAGVARRIGAPAIFGAVVIKDVPDDRRYVLYNTAVSSDAAGDITSRYDKQYLLTCESFPVLYKWSPNSGHFSPGTSLDPLLVPVDGETHRVTPLICYEDILPRFTNDAVRHADPDLLVNMTNDAWFGDTTEPWEHLALAQFRAVEHRRFLVRGTNSGISAVVDPVGRVVAHTSPFKEEALAATIHWMHPHTVYEVLGDWPWLLVSVALVVGAFRRRFPEPDPPATPSSPAPAAAV